MCSVCVCVRARAHTHTLTHARSHTHTHTHHTHTHTHNVADKRGAHVHVPGLRPEEEGQVWKCQITARAGAGERQKRNGRNQRRCTARLTQPESWEVDPGRTEGPQTQGQGKKGERRPGRLRQYTSRPGVLLYVCNMKTTDCSISGRR